MTTSVRAARSLAAVSVLGVAGLAVACSQKKTPPPRPDVPVAIATVRRSAVPVTLDAIGTVSPMQTAAVSAQVDGIITDVAFQEGQEVEKRQVLFRIDPRPYTAAFNQAKANLDRDRATAINAQKEAERYDQLVAKDYVTQEQADQERATAAAAQATVSADSASLANAQFNLDNTVVRAPIAGRTGNLLVRTGNLVHGSAGTPLVVINQIHPILVQFSVPATNLPDIQKYAATGSLPVTAYQVAQPGTAPAPTTPPPADAASSNDQPSGTAVGAPSAASAASAAGGAPGTRRSVAGGGRYGKGKKAGGPPNLAGGADPSTGTAASSGAADSAASAASDSTDNGLETPGLDGGPPGGGVTTADVSTTVPIGPGIGGTLSFVNNAVDTATGTVLLKATFANPKGELWPGEYVATVLRLYVQDSALVVPSQSVMTGQQGAYVFVVNTAANTVAQRPVVIGRSSDTLAVISSGLKEGERVVTDGQSRLQNGSKISVRALTGGTGAPPAAPVAGGAPRADSSRRTAR